MYFFRKKCYNYGASEVEFMKTIKKNLPDGVKKQFGRVKGVKVRFINKNLDKKKASK